MFNYEIIFKDLLKAETEEEVSEIIQGEEIFKSTENWKVYGNLENNWGSVGNQQDEATPALVEKLTNSIDALLLYKCKLEGLDPKSDNVPNDIFSAAEKFFGVKKNKLYELPKNKLSELANNIQLIATGKIGSEGYPSLSIADFGEGQNPKDFPNTFLSLYVSNKADIPFVTGKFNMGGTGVIRFCGKTNGYQLIVSKRSPFLKDSDNLWGFTLIKRLRPTGKRMRNSIIQYFAPNGDIPILSKKYLNLLPLCNGDIVEPYKIPMEWGTYVKLYEYQISQRSNILMDLFVELGKLLYEIPLPIRLVECRNYSGHTLESNLIGMDQRLEVDRSELLDSSFPSGASTELSPLGRVKIKYFLFKYDVDKKQLRRWVGRNPIYFTINGQTLATLPSTFLERQNVKLDFLKDYLLINIDCTEVPDDIVEDLFMPSRDRMTKGEIRYRIEDQLESILKSHDGLRKKNELYRQKKARDITEDESLKTEILNDIIQNNPMLAKLFGKGIKLSNPFKRGKQEQEFEGKRFPTYFKIAKRFDGDILKKECPKNGHCVILFKTDVVNDYLTRIDEPGELIYDKDKYVRNVFLFDGILHFEIHPNGYIKVGDELEFSVKLTSPEAINGYFQQNFKVLIIDQNSKKRKKRKNNFKNQGLALPRIYPIKKDKWEEFGGWDENDTIEIKRTETSTNAYINIDNIHLRREIDKDSANSIIIEDQFKFSMLIIGLGVKEKIEKLDSEIDPEKIFREMMNSIGGIIIPIVRNIGKIT